jgi:hypothetical protein
MVIIMMKVNLELLTILIHNLFLFFLLWFGLKQCNSYVHIYFGGVSLCNLIHMQIA